VPNNIIYSPAKKPDKRVRMGYKQAPGLPWFKQRDASAACYEDGDEKKALNIMVPDQAPNYYSEESGDELSGMSDSEDSESEVGCAADVHDGEQILEPEADAPEADAPEADTPEADAPEADFLEA